MDKSGLSRKEWFVALVAAHGGSSYEAASSLGVQPRQLPLTPGYIWDLIQSSQKQAAE